MSLQEKGEKLFKYSSFICLKKSENLTDVLSDLKSKIVYADKVNTYHPDRKEEFLLGRLCAAKAHQLCTGEELLNLPSNADRSPSWPSGIVGSISHDRIWTGAAVARSDKIVGIGIDFEQMGRAQKKVAKIIRTPRDLAQHPSFSEEELLTFIFSAKESLYKALYPKVKKYFGFEDAAICNIDTANNLFVIELLTDLSIDFNRQKRFSFEGCFVIEKYDCLTILEVD